MAATAAEEAQRDVDVAATDLTVAQSEVEVVTAQAADARAALEYEQTLLEHHALTAPFDSVVVERYAEAGMVVRRRFRIESSFFKSHANAQAISSLSLIACTGST